MSVKRLNLSFDLSREIDRRAYEILSLQSYKTIYVSEAVIAYYDKNDNSNYQLVKNALREVLNEFNLSTNIINQNINGNKENVLLPNEIFDVLNQL